MISIRPENINDVDNIYSINKRAFGSELEAGLVDGLRREAETFISLVAEEDGEILGHILFTEVSISGSEINALGLGPMAVIPERQGEGIGKKLISEGLEICRQRGTEAVFVLGLSEYYVKTGFKQCSSKGIYYRSDEFAPYFLYIELKEGALEGVSGEVKYHPLFENV